MKKHIWLLPLILFSLISLFGDLINERFDLVDFEVYYRTASRMLDGAAIYRIESDGHFVYKYAPSAALYFIPFLIFGFKIAGALYWLLMTAALAWGLWTLSELTKGEETVKTVNVAIFCSILAIVPHLHLEWHLGQVNLLLMVGYIALIKQFLQQQDRSLGLLLGASILVKPFGLIFLPYLLLRQRFKAIIYTIGAIIGIGALPLLLYPSWSEFIGLYSSWMTELKIEMASKQALITEGNHTIFSVLARYSPLQHLLTSSSLQKGYQVIVLGLMGLGFLKYMQWGKGQDKAIIGEIALLTAFIPLLAFTSQNAFLYCLPLILYLMFAFGEWPIWTKVLFIASCFLIGINMHDIVGREMHWQLRQLSIYTFGALGLIVVAFYSRSKLV